MNPFVRDNASTVKSGLDVLDKDGNRVGFVDQARDAQGWMQVEVVHLGLHRLWIPSRVVQSVDGDKAVVAVSSEELFAGYTNPPARETEVVHRDGRTIAVTHQASGCDGAPLVA